MPKRIHLSVEELEGRVTPAAGSLDPTFSGDGVLTQDLPGYYQTGAAKVLVQPDGKILVAGSARSVSDSYPALYRYNADGTPDATFNQSGFAVLTIPGGTGQLYSAALQPDGKIVATGTARIGGNYQVLVARLNADGTMDATFGGGSGVTLADPSPVDDNGFAVAVQADGKIVVGGSTQVQAGQNTTRMLALRFSADGALDTTFNGIGIVKIQFGSSDPSAHSVMIQGDGKILLAGTSSTTSGNFGFALARLNANGSADTTFGTSGLVQTSPANMQFEGIRDAVLLPDGKILAVGTAGVGQSIKPTPVLLRYTTTGAADATFDADGMVTTDLPNNGGSGDAIAVQPNGKILVAGGIGIPGGSNSILARYTTAGQLDTAFGPAGKTVLPGVVMTDLAPSDNDGYASVAIAPDRKVVAVGMAGGGSVQRLAVGRYDVNGPAPTAAADSYSVDENAVLTVSDPGVLANDTLPGGFPAAILVTQQPTHGMLQLSQTGGFTYTPTADYSGPDSFTYVLDNDRASAPAVVNLTVTQVLIVPIAVPDAYSVAEGGVLTVDSPGVLANDTLTGGQPTSEVVTRYPAHGSLQLSQGGGFIYTPAAKYSGSDSFAYMLDNGIASAPADVSLTVTPVSTPAGDFGWAVRGGGSGNDTGRSVAVDAAGNVFVTGGFQGTADFPTDSGPVTLTSAGGTDIFLAEYSAAGSLLWVRQVGGSGGDEGRGVSVDAAGNVYLMGFFSGVVDFGPGSGATELTSVGTSDLFVSRWDPSGNLDWAKQLGPKVNDYDYGYGVKADAAGNVYTIGVFAGTQDFDPGAGTYNLTSAGGTDIFVSKLDSDGNFVWADHFGGTAPDYGNAVTVDDAGNVYFTGFAQGLDADFDPGPGVFYLPDPNTLRICVTKLDASGGLVWAKAFLGDSYEVGLGIAVDSTGNVYTTGLFNGVTDFDPGPGTFNLTSNGYVPPNSIWDVYVSKLDANGNFVWANQLGNTAIDIGYGIDVDAAGNVYSTGAINGTTDFDPGPGTYDLGFASGYSTTFVRKLTPAGELVSAYLLGEHQSTAGYGLAVSGAGDVYTTGYFFGGNADFDPGPGVFNLAGAGSTDMYLTKLTPVSSTPSVTGVFTTAPDGVYGIGSTLEITVNFSESVTVTGTPLLLLETGGGTGQAVYSGGSGTNALTFLYTVAPGQSTAALDYAGNSGLVLNGGVIRAAAGNDATLTLATPGAAGSLSYLRSIAIDAPAVSVTASPASVTEDGVTNLIYTFTRSGPVTNPLTVDFSVDGTAAFGSDYAQSGATAFGLLTGTVGFAAGSSTATVIVDPTPDHMTEADETVTLTLTPAAGYGVGTSGGATGTIANDDIPPDTVITGGPAAVTTSRLATFAFTGSTMPAGGPATFQVSLDGAPFATAKSPKAYTNLADGTHTFRVRAVDAFGNADPTPASYTWAVDTTKPTVAISAPSATLAKAGDTVTYTVTYTDAHLQAVTLTAAGVTLNKTGTARGTVQVTGTGSTRTVTISNITGDGTLGITIKASTGIDQVGLKNVAASPSAKFVVDDSAPVVAIASPLSATVGGTASFTVTYTDASLATASLTAAQVTLITSPGMTGVVTVTQIDASHFKVSVSSISTTGTMSISVAGGVAQDAFGRLSVGPIVSKSVKVK